MTRARFFLFGHCQSVLLGEAELFEASGARKWGISSVNSSSDGVRTNFFLIIPLRCLPCSPFFSFLKIFFFPTGLGQCDSANCLVRWDVGFHSNRLSAYSSAGSPPSSRGHSTGALSPLHSSQTLSSIIA